eukprot:CAMPEP_0172817624 /NCGR_PEP_ID=MMETSP1075-20121228/13336_1 /TAXON_ID=2916 /ORGANISM="Ceratium fusus, Strain PA161109" /LENGTH=226 /DNA_ID=CAMNT_0013657855 /DNA_START=21 /DNA_END=698 /DNA_ORIENTATION=-
MAHIRVQAGLLLMALACATEMESDACPQLQRQMLQIASTKKHGDATFKTGYQLEVNMTKLSWLGKTERQCLQASSRTEVIYSACKKEAAYGWAWKDESSSENKISGKIRSLEYTDLCLSQTLHASTPWADAGWDIGSFPPIWSALQGDPLKLTRCDGKQHGKNLIFDTRKGDLQKGVQLQGTSCHHGTDCCVDASGSSSKVLVWECKKSTNEWAVNQKWFWEKFHF